jgi:hypothetical protein
MEGARGRFAIYARIKITADSTAAGLAIFIRADCAEVPNLYAAEAFLVLSFCLTSLSTAYTRRELNDRR